MKDKKNGATAVASGTYVFNDKYSIYPQKTQAKPVPEQLYFTRSFLWLPTKGGKNE